MFPTEIQGSHFYFRLSSKTENEPTNYVYSFILLPYIRSSYCLQQCRILWEETQKQQLLQMSAHLFGMFPSLNSVYSFYLQYFFS